MINQENGSISVRGLNTILKKLDHMTNMKTWNVLKVRMEKI